MRWMFYWVSVFGMAFYAWSLLRWPSPNEVILIYHRGCFAIYPVGLCIILVLRPEFKKQSMSTHHRTMQYYVSYTHLSLLFSAADAAKCLELGNLHRQVTSATDRLRSIPTAISVYIQRYIIPLVFLLILLIRVRSTWNQGTCQ